VQDYVLHDLRRTFSSKMAEWQIAPPHVVERILNHTTGSLTPLAKLYNRWSYLTEMRDAMSKYETRLAALFSTGLDAEGHPRERQLGGDQGAC
jgi:integrase